MPRKSRNIIETNYVHVMVQGIERKKIFLENRCKTQPIQDEAHLFNVISYIHRNPVKAGIVKKCKDYKFSSYNDFANNKVSSENIKLLFQTEDYKEIFNYIHRNYKEDNILDDKSFEDKNVVLKDFMNKKSITTLREIKKDKLILVEAIKEIKERCSITDKEISELLDIGKNRIYELINKRVSQIPETGKKGRP